MARILTGVQSTGVPHLGNVLGAIVPAVALSNDPKNDAFLFIADLHSLTSVKDPEAVRESTYAVAAAWLAFGFDIEQNTFYRQSDVPEVTELTWYLGCYTPYPMLANATSFKDKSDRLSDVNAGLFYYPVLMAADILLYDANFVPVGKDQQQHLEMTRDIAGSINHQCPDTLVVPEVLIDKNVMTVPGTDGQKMSKSYGNTIDIFLPEKQLKKQIMGIVTDSKGLDEAKDPEKDNVFNIYRLVASEDKTEEMRQNYLNGGYGYGHAKIELLETLLSKYEEPRRIYTDLMENKDLLDEKLALGADKARGVASVTLKRVRTALGY